MNSHSRRKKFTYSDLGLFLLVALYPILPERLEIIGLTSFNVFGILCIGFLMVSSHLSFSINKIFLKPNIVIYVLLTLFGYLYHSDYNKMGWFLVNQLFLSVLFLHLMNKKDYEFFCLMLNVVIMVASILAVLGIIETLTDFNIFDIISGNMVEHVGANSYRFGLVRCRGPFTNSINFSAYLFMVSVISLYRETLNKRRNYLSFFILFAGQLCTMSRSTLIIAVCIYIAIIIELKILVTKTVIKIFEIFGVFIAISGILQLFGINILRFLGNIILMIIALVNDSVNSYIAGIFGGNLSGIGDRLRLFKWVMESVRGYEFLGKGSSAIFLYKLNEHFTKWSLENYYLYTVFHHGFLQLGAEILLFISIVFYLYKNRMNTSAIEIPFRFSKAVFWIAIGYFAMLFCVGMADEGRLFYILVCLAVSYNYLSIRRKKDVS